MSSVAQACADAPEAAVDREMARDAKDLSGAERASLQFLGCRFYDPELYSEPAEDYQCAMCGTYLRGHEVQVPLCDNREIELLCCPTCGLSFVPHSGSERKLPEDTKLAHFVNGLAGQVKNIRLGRDEWAGFVARFDHEIMEECLPFTPAERDAVLMAAMSAEELDQAYGNLNAVEPFGRRWTWVRTENEVLIEDTVGYADLAPAEGVEALTRLGVRWYGEEWPHCPVCGRHTQPGTHILIPGENRGVSVCRCRYCGLTYGHDRDRGCAYPDQPPLPAFLIMLQEWGEATRAEQSGISLGESLGYFAGTAKREVDEYKLPLGNAARRAIVEVVADGDIYDVALAL